MRPFCAMLFAATLSGCAAAPATPPRTFDLGIEPPSAPLPAVRVAAVRAVAPFDGIEMHYRLAWRNPAELAAFAQNRWAAPPAELFRKQLLRANGAGTAKCALEAELHEFSQVFAAPTTSEARLELHASLGGAKGVVATRAWRIAEANAGADAAGGAQALARAVNRAVGEIAAWTAARPECGG